MDFNGIDDIGQGFAHELFVVFRRKHPEVKLITVNANEDVQKMISHVTANYGFNEGKAPQLGCFSLCIYTYLPAHTIPEVIA